MKRILWVALFVSILGNIYLLYNNRERNRVVRVVDGDSVDLKDGRRIRLLGIDAPEKERCMSQEARNRLHQLTDMVTDDYGRQLAKVYAAGRFVNEIMVAEGLAVGHSRQLTTAVQIARNNKLGIYSSTCRTNPVNDCLIKGNIRAKEKVYHLPDCDNYEQVIIDTAFGDQWFCTEAEAIRQGFRKAIGCL